MRSIKTITSIGDGPEIGGWARVRGVPVYVVQSGDTLSSIARAFLASSNRWPEIWRAQSDAFRLSRGGNPDVLHVGEALAMPAEAVERAIALGFLAAPAIAPSTPTPIAPPAVPSSPTSPPSSPSSTLLRVWSFAGITLGVGVLGAIAYALWTSHEEPTR